MKPYVVSSKFRDESNKELFAKDTFDGEAEDAKCALVEAYDEMARICAKDQRVYSIASTVSGSGEQISTTDYPEDLGSGMSGSGLMHEVAPEDLDPTGRGSGFATGGLIIIDENPDAWNDPNHDPIADIRAARREALQDLEPVRPLPTGGTSAPVDTFRGAEGTTECGGDPAVPNTAPGAAGDREGSYATGGIVSGPAKRFNKGKTCTIKWVAIRDAFKRSFLTFPTTSAQRAMFDAMQKHEEQMLRHSILGHWPEDEDDES